MVASPLPVSFDPQGLVALFHLSLRLSLVPLGRVGRREEVAYAVLFPDLDEASYITGTELVVNGGYLAL